VAPQDCETLEAEFPKELIVIEEMIVVVGGVFLFLPNSPFEKLLTKSAGAILIVCAQVSYTECTGQPLIPKPLRRHLARSAAVSAFSTAT
jgi:hypothetical protein